MASETKYYLKHNNDLNPLVSRKEDLTDLTIPIWDESNQRLRDSQISQNSSNDEITLDSKAHITDDTDIQGTLDVSSSTSIGDTLTVDGESQFNADVTVGKSSAGSTNVTVYGNLNITGDIIQDGSSYETHAEQLYTKKDHIILREDAVSAITDHAGLIFNKYDGTNDLHLDVTSDGYAKVGEIGTTTYTYTYTDNKVYFNGTAGSESLSDYWDNSTFTKQHDFHLPSGAYDLTFTNNAVTGKAYYNVTISYKLDGNTLQRISTIENPINESLTYYDNNSRALRTLVLPSTVGKDGVVPVYDGNRITLKDYTSGTGNGSVFVGTKAEYNAALLIPEGDEGYLPEHSIIIITDADEEYLEGEEQ